jgi:ribosomal protein RSM22 (predicted rRNA methylase)
LTTADEPLDARVRDGASAFGSAVDRAISRFDAGKLTAASRRLSERYRRREPPSVIEVSDAAAYAAVRSPATFAASASALREVARTHPSCEPREHLDLGAGTGSAAWAAASVWPSITSANLVERSEAMIRVGRDVRSAAAAASVAPWDWQRADITTAEPVPHDLVTVAYALGELDPPDRLVVARTAWRAARELLVVIEPGTPHGFECIRAVRELLVADGAAIIAPCPHEDSCPMSSGKWCHFRVRLERSDLHRRAKEAELPFEDEAFSYVAFVRSGAERAPGRIVGHPRRPPRRVELEVCATDGLRSIVVPRSSDEYRGAKRLRWGDPVPSGVLSIGRRRSGPDA